MSLGNHEFIGVEVPIKVVIFNDLYKYYQVYFLDIQLINIKFNEALILKRKNNYKKRTSKIQ